MRILMSAAAGLVLACAAGHAQAIALWPGAAPGSESWTHGETVIENTPLGTVVFNVVTPTLTAYLPDRAQATGWGVIIAPGGAFVALAIDLEGHHVARWLQARGIAAFVLKYRTVEKRQDGVPAMDMDTAGRYGIADGMQAVQLVRRRAAEWGLAPDRVGFLGFSAGAMVASAAVLHPDPAARPSFAALIYGAPFGELPAIPDALPPLFLAWARDDAVAQGPITRFLEALAAAGHSPEIRVFDAGGHGFGMKTQGTSSDRWIEAFHTWLGPPKPPAPIRSVVESLPPASQVRVTTRQGTVVGRVTGRSADSLTLAPRASAAIVTVSLDDVDTLWVAAPRGHTALAFGVAAGALVAVRATAGGPGDDPGLGTAIAAIGIIAGALIGMIIDSAGESWIQQYPHVDRLPR